MKKEIIIEKDVIILREYKKKFLSTEYYKNEYKIPVHLIKLVQKAYSNGKGTASFTIFLETEDEYLITYDEIENIDSVFEELIELKNEVKSFRVELYNIETCETIDK